MAASKEKLQLPEVFQQRMQQMLGDEYETFLHSYEEPRHRGLRVNTMKISAEEFEKITPFPIKRIPWVDNGYFYPNDIYPAQNALYAAGVYYLQEPSAMTPAQMLPIAPGDKVLDLCAAPGGKSTALAAKLNGTGLLVANDISNSRAKALLRNLELFGTANSYVTNETPERLAEAFPFFFDKILVDAPCSGEGMFRKNPAAAEEWSPAKVAELSRIQRGILKAAISMLRPGGMLLYSTCTFAPEENEQALAYLLTEFPEMHVCEMPGYDGFLAGRPEWLSVKTSQLQDAESASAADWQGVESEKSVCRQDAESEDTIYEKLSEEIKKSVRIWPHRMNGEGHFLALLQKAGGDHQAESAESRPSDRFNEESPNIEAVLDKKSKKKNKKKRQQEWLATGGKGVAGKASGGRNKGKRNAGGKADGQMGREEELLLSAFLTDFVGSGSVEEQLCRMLGLSESAAQPKEGDERHESHTEMPMPERVDDRTNRQLECRADKAYFVQQIHGAVGGLKFLRNGLYVGDWKKNRFEPSQPLALAVKPRMLRPQRVLCLTKDDERVDRFRIGEQINLNETEQEELESGWVLVCVGDFAIGWGKAASGTVKNKIPVSWRS